MLIILCIPYSYPNSGLEGKYCRNPGGEPGPWCYTLDGPRFELCGVPKCSRGSYLFFIFKKQLNFHVLENRELYQFYSLLINVYMFCIKCSVKYKFRDHRKKVSFHEPKNFFLMTSI